MVSTLRMLLMLAALSSACGSADEPTGQTYIRNAGTDVCPHARDPNVARADFDPNLGIGRCVYFCDLPLLEWCGSVRQCVTITDNFNCGGCGIRCSSRQNCRRFGTGNRAFACDG